MYNFDIDETFASLSAKAGAAGDILDIADITALSEYEDASEDDIRELLSL